MSDFSSRLKHLRVQKELSQTDLSKLVGVLYNHINRYERRQSKPTAATLGKLAESLGVSSDFLMEGRTEDAAKATFQDRQLLMQFKEVEKHSDSDKHVVKEFLGTFFNKEKASKHDGRK